MIHVVCVHTAMALVEPLTKIFQEYLPEVNVNHIADSSLIKEVIAAGEVTPAVRRRLLSYYNGAAEAAQRIAPQVDMFVLAQGSMARMEQRLSELTGKPVLSSPVLGVKGLRKFLNI